MVSTKKQRYTEILQEAIGALNEERDFDLFQINKQMTTAPKRADVLKSYDEALASCLEDYTRFVMGDPISPEIKDETRTRMVYKLLKEACSGNLEWGTLTETAWNVASIIGNFDDLTLLEEEEDKKDEASEDSVWSRGAHLKYLITAHNALVRGIDVESMLQTVRFLKKGE